MIYRMAFLYRQQEIWTSIKNSFWSSFDKYAKILIIGVIILKHISYEKIEFDIRTKRNLAFSLIVISFILINVSGKLISNLVNIHYRLHKLYKSSFRSISFAFSLNIKKAFFGYNQSFLAFNHITLGYNLLLKTIHWYFFKSGIQLFYLVFGWVKIKYSVCS